jgi:CHAD domain-containing protein
MSYRLEPDEGVREAITRSAREQVDRAIREITRIGEDPATAVHSARKALKKERSLLRLAHGSMSPAQRRRENDALRRAAQKLSGVRDAEVMRQTLDRLAERFAGQLPETTFAAVRERLERRRATHGTQRDGSPDDQALRELDELRRRIDGWKLSAEGWKAIEAGLQRSYRRGRRGFDRARTHRSLEELHDWRKRVKDLWYHERLVAPVCGPAIKGQAEDAHRLADLLGDDHDLGVLRQVLTEDQVDAPVDLDALIALIDHRRTELQTEAIELGRRVYAEKPKAFRRRMRACWKAGTRLAEAPAKRQPAKLAEATRAVHAV